MTTTAVLSEVSSKRATDVLSIPLSEAKSILRRAAVDAEIRYPNHVLRLLHELDGPEVGAEKQNGLRTFLRLVEPLGHHGYRQHVAQQRVTFCGLSTDGWRDHGRITPDAAVTRESICRRCRRSVELELEEE